MAGKENGVCWPELFKSARPIIIQANGDDPDDVTAVRAVSIASIVCALKTGGIVKDKASVIERLEDSGVSVVHEISTGEPYVSRIELECVCYDIDWEEKNSDIAELRKALSSIVNMVSEMYVPLVQKDLLRKIAEKVGV